MRSTTVYVSLLPLRIPIWTGADAITWPLSTFTTSSFQSSLPFLHFPISPVQLGGDLVNTTDARGINSAITIDALHSNKAR